ncbi:transmembrane protein 50B isoform X1 [Tachysurus ichikawai]
MAGFLDNFRWPECECIDWGEKRNTVASTVAGFLFFTGWWVIIDASVHYPKPEDLNHAFHTCGVFSTLAFFMLWKQEVTHVRGDTLPLIPLPFPSLSLAGAIRVRFTANAVGH